MSDVVWYSGEDDSWGLCKREDLLVVDVKEFTSEEWAELGSPGEARSDVDVIIAVHERVGASIYDLWKLVRKHPDYIGGVIFTTDDVENAATGTDRDASKMDTARAMKYWEDGACGEGMDALIECAQHEQNPIVWGV